MAVGGGADLNDERWEEDKHSQALHPDKATFMLTLMGTETVEGVPKGGDMEAVPNQDAFAIDGNDGRARAEDQRKRTQQPETGRYEMIALLSRIMWSVAPVLATRRL